MYHRFYLIKIKILNLNNLSLVKNIESYELNNVQLIFL